MSLNINKINSLLCLFEKADKVTVDSGPMTEATFVSDCHDEYDDFDVLVEINWESEGLYYECNLTAGALSEAKLDNSSFIIDDQEGNTCKIFLFKLTNLVNLLADKQNKIQEIFA